MTFRDELTDWCDWDDAAYALGNALHVFDGVDKRYANGAIMTANDFGNGLHKALKALVKAGVLEHRLEPDEQFRWVFGGPEGLVGARESDEVRQSAVEGDPARTPAPPASFATADPAGRKWWQRGPLSPS